MRKVLRMRGWGWKDFLSRGELWVQKWECEKLGVNWGVYSPRESGHRREKPQNCTGQVRELMRGRVLEGSY